MEVVVLPRTDLVEPRDGDVSVCSCSGRLFFTFQSGSDEEDLGQGLTKRLDDFVYFFASEALDFIKLFVISFMARNP